jgi:hypothetical protein
MYIYPGDMITTQGPLRGRRLGVILEIRLGSYVKMTRYGVRTGCEPPVAYTFLYRSYECKVGTLSV